MWWFLQRVGWCNRKRHRRGLVQGLVDDREIEKKRTISGSGGKGDLAAIICGHGAWDVVIGMIAAQKERKRAKEAAGE